MSTDVALRYAEALSDALPADDQTRAQVRSELDGFAEAVQQSFDLANVLQNPSVGASERLSVLDAVIGKMKLSPPVARFLRLLADRGRLQVLGDITEAYRRLDDARTGIMEAVIETATELSDDELDRIRKALQERTGAKLDASVVVRPELIGGIRARVGTMIFDGSVRAELDRLREQLESAGSGTRS